MASVVQPETVGCIFVPCSKQTTHFYRFLHRETKFKYSVSLSIGTSDIFPNESAVSFYRFCSLDCQQWFQLPVCEEREDSMDMKRFYHLLSLFSYSLTITYSYDRPLLPLPRSLFTLQRQIGMPLCWRFRVRFLLFILYFLYGVDMFWKLKQP